MDENYTNPANEENVTPTGDQIRADLGSGVKNAQVGKNLNQSVDERNQNTNVYLTIPEFRRYTDDNDDDRKRVLPVEVEREFRRYFTEINVSLNRMMLMIDAVAKETNTNTSSVANLREQAVKTEKIILDYQEEIEEKVAGLKIPPDDQIKQAAIHRNRVEIRMQVILTVSLWLLFIIIAAQQLGIMAYPK